jgi:hypothetical protein
VLERIEASRCGPPLEAGEERARSEQRLLLARRRFRQETDGLIHQPTAIRAEVALLVERLGMLDDPVHRPVHGRELQLCGGPTAPGRHGIHGRPLDVEDVGDGEPARALGVWTSTSSPTFRPMSARAIGDVTETSPAFTSASSSPTIR